MSTNLKEKVDMATEWAMNLPDEEKKKVFRFLFEEALISENINIYTMDEIKEMKDDEGEDFEITRYLGPYCAHSGESILSFS